MGHKKYLITLFGFVLVIYLYFVDMRFVLRGETPAETLRLSCDSSMRYSLTITSILKNSAPYIREWIEYHRIQGVEHFYLIDNNSQDNLTAVLRPYIEGNIVTLTHWNDVSYRDETMQVRLKTQQKALVHSLAKYGCQSEWTALIDDDEFILPKHGKTILEILDSYKSYGGITMGWAWFGSNGHVDKPKTLVIESYTKRQAKLDRLYKTIIQPKYLSWMKTIHYPMFPSSYPLVTEKFERVSTNWKHNHPTNDIIQLNHYKVKSWEEWIERVRVRGAVAGPHWRDTLADFKSWDVNEVEDTEMLQYSQELRERLGKEIFW